MPNTRYRLRSELPNIPETQSLLAKIKENVEIDATRIVFEMGLDRFNASLCSDVLITATGTTGNIQFRRAFQPAAAYAHLLLQGMTFTALAHDSSGNAITIAFTQKIAATFASLIVQDLTYTAKTAGTAGNAVTIAYTTGATAGAEVVTVVGSTISVQIETGVSTATQVKAAIDGDTGASVLVAVAVSGTGSNAQTAPVSATHLAGGAAAIGSAGAEVVTVTGSAISVRLESGVSTRTQVKAALDGSGPAAALISTSVASGATVVTAPASATNLAGGVTGPALETYDIADLENIRRLRTKKHLIVIKADANPA